MTFIDTAANNRQLAAAIINQAVKDMVTGGAKDTTQETQDKVRKETRAWLLGEDCQFYCDCLDFDHSAIVTWLKNGNKPLNKRLFLEQAHD